jgi:c-di-GMP-binding flagellar brake protein YcgR
MFEDKRASPRFLYTEPVTYGFPDVSVSGGVAGNISLGGIALRVQGFIPIGTILELQIHLDKTPKVIWAKAKIVRMREVLCEDCYEIGLQFVRDEMLLRAIGEYIITYRSNPTHQV